MVKKRITSAGGEVVARQLTSWLIGNGRGGAGVAKSKPVICAKKKQSRRSQGNKHVAEQWWYKFSKEAFLLRGGQVVDPEEPGAEFYGLLSCAQIEAALLEWKKSQVEAAKA